MPPLAATSPIDPGDPFKDRERNHRVFLDDTEFAVIRLDGRAFHTYCKDLDYPFDEQFMADMDATAKAVTGALTGARLTYVQSDEISVVLTAWRPGVPATGAEQLMFGGNVQKLVSITASVASATFNQLRPNGGLALFDARAFTLPARADVTSYFAWRQSDARRNSLSMLARSVFSSKELHGVSSTGQRTLLRDRGYNPDALPDGFRNGRVVVPVAHSATTTFTDGRSGETRTVEYERRSLDITVAPNFTDLGRHLIPEERTVT